VSYLHQDVTEDEFLGAVEDVVASLQKRFMGVAYYSSDDVAQELRVLALEALPHFDREKGTLRSYLYKSARNRWLNHLRQFQGRRNDPACRICHAARLGRGPGHPDGECRAYKSWYDRNRIKANLGRPRDIAHSDETESRIKANSVAEADAEAAELLQLLDERLDVEDRRLLLQMREGVTVTKRERQALERRVLAILEEVGLSASDIGLDDDPSC
jgi:RNA polymerase sigma factor (sigma-70 family)